jgi:hypothetical protein
MTLTRYAIQCLPLLALMVLTSGCGLAETAGTTAAIAESKAEELKQAKQTQAKIEQKLDDAQEAAAAQRKAAEDAGQ